MERLELWERVILTLSLKQRVGESVKAHCNIQTAWPHCPRLLESSSCLWLPPTMHTGNLEVHSWAPLLLSHTLTSHNLSPFVTCAEGFPSPGPSSEVSALHS